MAGTYCRVVGVVLIALGIVGYLAQGTTWLEFAPRLNLMHLVSGVVLAYLGFTGPAAGLGAQAFGLVYTVVALLGFFGGGRVPVLDIPATALHNLAHLAIGALGLWAGFGVIQGGRPLNSADGQRRRSGQVRHRGRCAGQISRPK